LAPARPPPAGIVLPPYEPMQVEPFQHPVHGRLYLPVPQQTGRFGAAAALTMLAGGGVALTQA